MASLVEELLDVLKKEKEGYDAILSMCEEKRDSIVHSNIDVLERVTAQEEDIASDLKNLENRRARLLTDMATVLGKDGQNLTITQLIELLDRQPGEQKDLLEARDALVDSARKVQFWNVQNQNLLKQAMEMVEFDLNLYKSLKQAPETANYNRNAYNTGDLLGSSSFDSKQ